MKRNKWYLLELALMVGVSFWLLTGAMALNSQDQLADKVVRLHVLANSDSPEDQALKLQVRDRILDRATEILETSTDRTQAEARIRGSILELERLAAQEVRARGYSYPVTAELAEVPFPTRAYEGFTLPAGNYLALRILIGEARGQNWWCVVFPPLCTAAASDVPDTALAAGLSAEQVGLITGEHRGYVLKFKTMELWEQLRARFA